jgi:hypothetical protein
MALTRLGTSAYTTLDATKLTGTLPAISGANLTGISAGKVLQVVETRVTATASTSSSSFSDISGMSASITPSSTSNKILVLAVLNISSNNHTHTKVLRGSTDIGTGVAVGSRPAVSTYHNIDANSCRTAPITILDSPNSTSSQNYKIQWRANASSGYLNRTYNDVDAGYGARSSSSITLLEIEG